MQCLRSGLGPSFRFIFLIFFATAFFLTACGEGRNNQKIISTGSEGGFSVSTPSSFQKNRIGLNLSAELVVDGRSPIPLTLDLENETVTGPPIQGLSPGKHTLTINYYLDGVLVATASASAEVVAGQTTTIGPGLFQINEDLDNDTFSGIDEILSGKNPEDALSFPRPPIANAGVDLDNLTIGVSVALDGSASSDPDSDLLNNQWAFQSLPGASRLIDSNISDAGTSAASFIPDVIGSYTLALIVNDGLLSSVTDTVIVKVKFAVPRFAYVTNFADDTISVYTVNATSGQLIHHGYTNAGDAPRSVAIDPSGQFAYVTNLGSFSISAYTIDAITGALSSVPGFPLDTGGSPVSVIVDPSGQFVYAANSGSDNVLAYVIDKATGGLLPIPGSPFATGDRPVSLIADPSGQFLYVLNRNSENVSAYTIDAITGVLLPIPGSPYITWIVPSSMAVDPTGKFVYVTNEASNNVSAYTIDIATGALSPIKGAPFDAGDAPVSVAVDPSGQFVYVTNKVSNNISAYTIDSVSGALSPISGSPFTVGDGPVSVIVDPSGKFVYVVNISSSTVSSYRIDTITGGLSPTRVVRTGTGARAIAMLGGTKPIGHAAKFSYVANVSGNISANAIDGTTGALLPVSGSPFDSVGFPASVAADPSGRFLYVAHQINSTDKNVAAYTIDEITGALLRIRGTPFDSGGMYPASVVVDPSGRFVYVANQDSDTVTVFILDKDTGVLCCTTPRKFFTGEGPHSIAIDPSGQFLYIANDFSHNISAYTINAVDGGLLSIPGSPFTAGTFPLSVMVDPSGRFVYVANRDSNNVSAYTIDNNGALSPIMGSFSTGNTPSSLTLDPSGQFAYVSNKGSDNLSAYTIDGDTGVLVSMAASPFSTEAVPESVTVDPSGRFMYVVSSGSISAYSIDAVTGVPSSIEDSPFVAEDEAFFITTVGVID